MRKVVFMVFAFIAVNMATTAYADGHMPGDNCIEFSSYSGVNVTKTWCIGFATKEEPCKCTAWKEKKDTVEVADSLMGKAKAALQKAKEAGKAVRNPIDTLGNWLDKKLDIDQ